MSEVSLQKSLPYCCRMCRLLRQRSDYCHRVAIFCEDPIQFCQNKVSKSLDVPSEELQLSPR